MFFSSRRVYPCIYDLERSRSRGDLTRALLGGRLNAPLRFFEDSKNTAARSAAGFSPTLPLSFPQLLWKFRPKAMWGQVTRSGQVTQLQNNFPIAPRLQCFRESYETFGIWWRLSVPTKRISLDFWYRWPQVRSFLRPPHYKSMDKKSTLLYLLWRKRFWVESYRIQHLWTIRVKNCITYPSKGHLRSSEVTNRHLPITFDQKEIETWDWCQYVRLGQANRLICNMTHFGHHVTLAWLDLRSNFDLDLSKSFYILFDAP